MNTSRLRRYLLAIFFGLIAGPAWASNDPLFHSQDALANRDEWGVYHQQARTNPVDFAPRLNRSAYYFMSRRRLLADPAYVGALQVALKQRGYYCGPIDGIMSEQVNLAIARCQKNHWQAVDGGLTVPVRRVLHLP